MSGSFDRIPIANAEPFVLTLNRNHYIIVVGDYLTKWMEAYGVPLLIKEEFWTQWGVFQELCCLYISL